MKSLDIYISDISVQPQAQRLAEIYAQALTESLDASTSPEDAVDELTAIDGLIESIAGARELLISPTVSRCRRTRIMDDIGRFVSPPVAGLLDVLAKNGRIELIGLIAKACSKVIVREAGEIEMTVRSAVTLDESTKNRIAGQLAEALGAKCIIDNVVDPKIIGGLILQKGDTVFDASIAGRLERIAEKFDTAK